MTDSILVVDDEPMVRKSLAQAVARGGVDVLTAGDAREALAMLDDSPCPMVFTDLRMPGMDGLTLLRSIKQRTPSTQVVIVTAFASDAIVAEARRAGASEILNKPFTYGEIRRTLETLLGAAAADESERRAIITADRSMERLLAVARRVSRTDATVLIEGETGTGKELLARFIHRHSPRAAGPFVAVNCAALPEALIESELFGHERGAFTGAQARRIGAFEAAAGGTIVLDEISELPLGLQAKLLRVLQESEIQRVGATRPIRLDVRVIAMTNRDLRAEVAAGRFRADLFYRLDVVALRTPSLRERSGDIPLLARHFLTKYAALHASPVTALAPPAIERLLAHGWPGNVRELENTIQRAVILAASDELDADDIVVEEALAPAVALGGRTITELQRDVILATLERMGGNRTHAARALGVTARTIRNHLRRYREAAAAAEPAAEA